jgi:peptidase YpeB-like protein
MLLIHVSELSGGGADTAPMYRPSRRTVLGCWLGTASLFLAGVARADRDDPTRGEHDDPVRTQHDDGWHHDHDRARLAVERGEAQPLSDILAQVRPALGGEVVGVAFRRKANRWLYEFRVIDPAGRMTEVYVDAATAEIVRREAH